MKNRKLLEKFMKDNFYLEKFNIHWYSDWLVQLIDTNGDKLSLSTFNPYVITCNINSEYYSSYRLEKNLPSGKDMWVVFNENDR